MARYVDHYEAQLQGGGGIETVFRGVPHQRGHGIGSFLGGLFRRVLPFLTSGVRAVGKEVLRTGINVMEDMEQDTPFKQALKNRARESRDILLRKAEEKVKNIMKGSGYKADPRAPGHQSMLARLNRLATARAARGRVGKVSKRRRVVKKKKKKKKSLPRKTGPARKKAGKRARSNKKRAVTDIFGPE